MTKDKIILALDVESPEIARRVIEETSGEVGAYKIGLELFTIAGPDFVRELVDEGLRIFLDLKFHDIPNTVAKASVAAARLGVWMFNVHSSGGGEMMKRAVAEVSDFCLRENTARPIMIGVTLLTSLDSHALTEIGMMENADRQVETLARLAKTCGLDGVVASPHEIAGIRSSIADKNFFIVTPGVRPTFATADDQKRVMTPAEALTAGSDYLVIGRPILNAEDKRAAIAQIIRECDHRSASAIMQK